MSFIKGPLPDSRLARCVSVSFIMLPLGAMSGDGISLTRDPFLNFNKTVICHAQPAEQVNVVYAQVMDKTTRDKMAREIQIWCYCQKLLMFIYLL